MSGNEPEHGEDEKSGEGDQPQGTHIDDLPTKTKREVEEEMLETPAAP